MRKFVNQLLITRWSRKLLEGGLVLTGAGVIIGLLGYAYQILMGRILSPADFSLLSAVIALFVFMNAPFSALAMIVSRRVAHFSALENKAHMSTLFLRSHRYSFFWIGAVVVIFFFVAAPLQRYLRAADSLPIWCLAFLLCVAPLSAITSGFLQGLQKFSALGTAGIIAAVLKIVFSLVFVSFGLEAVGAIFGFFVSQVLVWIASVALIVRRCGVKVVGHPINNSSGHDSQPIKADMVVFVATIAFTAMTQLDMVFVNYFFDSELAADYAAASILGKAVLYIPTGFALSIFPLTAEKLSRNESSYHFLFQTFVVTFLCCLPLAIFYFLFSDWVVILFFGSEYSGASDLLRWYGIAILPMALVMVAEYYLIAQGRVLFAWLFLAIAPLQFLSICLWHEELWMVIAIIGIFGGVTAVVGYSFILRGYLVGPSLQPPIKGV